MNPGMLVEGKVYLDEADDSEIIYLCPVVDPDGSLLWMFKDKHEPNMLVKVSTEVLFIDIQEIPRNDSRI